MYASDYEVPDEIKAFGWALLNVHLQKLTWLTEHTEKGGKTFPTLTLARKYLEQLMDGGPNDPAFNDWCREALESSGALIAEASQPILEVVEGDGQANGDYHRPMLKLLDQLSNEH